MNFDLKKARIAEWKETPKSQIKKREISITKNKHCKKLKTKKSTKNILKVKGLLSRRSWKA